MERAITGPVMARKTMDNVDLPTLNAAVTVPPPGTAGMQCRDEVFVPATPFAVHDVLSDLRAYEHWWMLMRAGTPGRESTPAWDAVAL